MPHALRQRSLWPQPLDLCSGTRCNWRVAPLTATGEKACFPQQRLSTTKKKKAAAALGQCGAQEPPHPDPWAWGWGGRGALPDGPPTPSSGVSLRCLSRDPPAPSPHLRLLCTLPHSHTPTSVGIDGHGRARGFYGKVSITPSLFLYPVPPGDS